MGRILRFRRRGQIPEFEEALAHLTEELTLTQSYADLMIRSGHYKAAAAVVDEQRARLAGAQEAMLTALRPRRRSHAAIAGLAAVMLVGSASFAALSSRNAEDPTSTPVVLERVEAQLEEAATESDQARANTIVAEALAELISIGPEMSQDPEIQRQVESMLRKQIDRLTQRPSTQSLIAQIAEAAKKVKAEIKDPPSPEPQPEPKPESQPAPPAAPPA